MGDLILPSPVAQMRFRCTQVLNHIKMKSLLLLPFLFWGMLSFSQQVEKISIPKGIVYKYCTPKVLEKATTLLKEDLQDSTKYNITDEIMIIGPILWDRYKNVPELAEIKEGNVILNVGSKKLNGKMTQDIQDSKKVWNYLRNEVKGKTFIIRKANEVELKYYWSVISFDIDEPLFILETSEHSYIINLIPDKLKIIWLDEVPK